MFNWWERSVAYSVLRDRAFLDHVSRTKLRQARPQSIGMRLRGETMQRFLHSIVLTLGHETQRLRSLPGDKQQCTRSDDGIDICRDVPAELRHMHRGQTHRGQTRRDQTRRDQTHRGQRNLPFSNVYESVRISRIRKIARCGGLAVGR